MVTNAKESELRLALERINKKYFEGNICFKRQPECYRSKKRFTLTVLNSSRPGSRRSPTGRKIAAACWHVHGYFFEELFKINPEVWVKTNERKITKEQGNWEDSNIGNYYHPYMYSEACECN